jgi:thiosulfate dehydrogenase (quinone) large subunit
MHQTTEVTPSSAGKGADTSAVPHGANKVHISPWTRPPRSSRLSGWALLPLRAFIGFTFCFAGLQKLANPNFFKAASPISIQAQLTATTNGSPLHGLLRHLNGVAVPLGIFLALAELAVGLGMLSGLLTRVAAVGGMLIAFSLFLTVSFHASPYYTGADIVFFFAFMPFVAAGAGGVLSLDGYLADRSAREAGLGSAAPVVMPFARVQALCGHFEAGRCSARGGDACAIAPCPVLTGSSPVTAVSSGSKDGDGQSSTFGRRQAVMAGTVAAVGVVTAGVVVGVGRWAGGATPPSSATVLTLPPAGKRTRTKSTSAPTTAASDETTTTGAATTTTAATPSGTVIGSATGIPVGSAATFTAPKSGDPAVVLHPETGTFVAFDTVCPHQGCTVAYSPAAKLMVCPCHGSRFNPRTGAVLQGPATTGLTPIKVTEGPDGNLYAT